MESRPRERRRTTAPSGRGGADTVLPSLRKPRRLTPSPAPTRAARLLGVPSRKQARGASPRLTDKGGNDNPSHLPRAGPSYPEVRRRLRALRGNRPALCHPRFTDARLRPSGSRGAGLRLNPGSPAPRGPLTAPLHRAGPGLKPRTAWPPPTGLLMLYHRSPRTQEGKEGPRSSGRLHQAPFTPALGREAVPLRMVPAASSSDLSSLCVNLPDCCLLSPSFPVLSLVPLSSRPPMLLLPSPLSPTVSSNLKWPSPPRTAVPLRASVCPSLTPFSAGTAAYLCPR